eukprot:jgi/Psemu1/49023/gm1.49023_g
MRQRSTFEASGETTNTNTNGSSKEGGTNAGVVGKSQKHKHKQRQIRRGSSSSSSSGGYKKLRGLSGTIFLVLFLIVLVVSIQLLVNSVLYENGNNGNANQNAYANKNQSGNSNLRGQQPSYESFTRLLGNSYDSLLKNTIRYDIPGSGNSNRNDNNNNNNNNNPANNNNNNLSVLEAEIQNLRSQIRALESKSQKYVDDPRFFPFVIRDSRHLTPVQIDPDFHVFDYVDLTKAIQPRSMHSQLLHNARIVVDEDLEARRGGNGNGNGTTRPPQTAQERARARIVSEKYEAPCQKYSLECYRQKVLQVFSYVLREFPSVEYYFYAEADNDLCVPMTMVKDLALTEKRYFINTGIGFSGWIMSREFMGDFLRLYGNETLDKPVVTTKPGTNEVVMEKPEIRPDVLASYYLTDKHAWAVTRQYWVSHTTLESLGIASLTVKDRRYGHLHNGERMKLDKHLPRCLEPRRAKWKVRRKKPHQDPRDRFGWDYFDYEVCPDSLIFPCGGAEQLKQLVENDWRIANETGALKYEEARLKWMEQEQAKAEAKGATVDAAGGTQQKLTLLEKVNAVRKQRERAAKIRG